MNYQLAKIFARVLKIPEANINEGISRGNIVEWDSLNHLMLLTEIEKSYNVKFAASDVLKMNSFKEIDLFLKQKGF